MKKEILIGTSGWNYKDWIGKFYPKGLKSYEDLKFFSRYYRTVENNSSFYHISKAVTFKKWYTSTPENFVFSMKLNRLFTHDNKLVLNDELIEKLKELLSNTQELKEKFGALLIQTPPSLRYDLTMLRSFLDTFTGLIKELKYQPDLAIEFRNKYWFTEELYELLREYKVAWTIGQSSRYPGARIITGEVMYIRFHGPTKLFASLYTNEEMEDWWKFIQSAKGVKKVYIYFNNDFFGYAIDNSRYLQKLSGAVGPEPYPESLDLGI